MSSLQERTGSAIDQVMANVLTEAENTTLTKEDYNNEPVHYCKNCLSLRIMGTEDMEFCDECGSVQIDTCSIGKWDLMYRGKYGMRYLERELK